MLKYEAGAGEHIDTAARNLAQTAETSGQTVQMTFNGILLTAGPSDKPEDIVATFSAESERRAKEYAESPAGQDALRKAAEFQENSELAKAEGILPFSITDQAAWDEAVAANQDAYGACTVRYAARWAHLMEKRIENKGENLADIATEASHEADKEGVTGFMHGCAVGILSKVWLYGEPLRKWHNLDTQIGTEGEKANETGGVLNPAILSIA